MSFQMSMTVGFDGDFLPRGLTSPCQMNRENVWIDRRSPSFLHPKAYSHEHS